MRAIKPNNTLNIMTVIYTNLLSLSPRILDTLNVYVQPLFGLFTLVCSLLCAIVFASSRLKGVTYQHLFLDALASAVYGLSNSWTFIIRCGALCMYGYNYWSKFYEVNCYIYIGKSLELFVLLLEIHLSYLRIASFSKEKKGKDWIPMYVRFVIFFCGRVFYVCTRRDSASEHQPNWLFSTGWETQCYN